MDNLKSRNIDAENEKKAQKVDLYCTLHLLSLGLNNPTTVERGYTKVTTTGLDINTLVKVWRAAYHLADDIKIILLCSSELYERICSKACIISIAEHLKKNGVIVRKWEATNDF